MKDNDLELEKYLKSQKVWKDSNSHPWTEKELRNTTLMIWSVCLFAFSLWSLIIYIIYKILKILT